MAGKIERNSHGLIVKYGDKTGKRALGGEVSVAGPFGVFKILMDKKKHQKEFWDGNPHFVALGAHIDNEWVINNIEFFVEETNPSGDNIELNLCDEDGNVITTLASFTMNVPVGSSSNFGPFTVPTDCLLQVVITDANSNDVTGRLNITIEYTV